MKNSHVVVGESIKTRHTWTGHILLFLPRGRMATTLSLINGNYNVNAEFFHRSSELASAGWRSLVGKIKVVDGISQLRVERE